MALAAPLSAAVDQIAQLPRPRRQTCVLVSGDPGFFGLARLAAARLAPGRLVEHPAPSSVALAFARIGIHWDDAVVVSAHGRPVGPAIDAVLAHPKVAVLSAPDCPPRGRSAAAGWRRLPAAAGGGGQPSSASRRGSSGQGDPAELADGPSTRCRWSVLRGPGAVRWARVVVGPARRPLRAPRRG